MHSILSMDKQTLEIPISNYYVSIMIQNSRRRGIVEKNGRIIEANVGNQISSSASGRA